MYVAYKYGKRKYRERQERKDAETVAATAPEYDVDYRQHSPIHSPDGLLAPVPLYGNTDLTEKKNGKDNKTKKLELTPEEKAERSRRRKYRFKIIFGLFLPFTLQTLDTTIIASALPFIARDFNQESQLNWIISAFNLTSAAFLPFWAQIADIFGRHVTIHVTILFMTLGSAICTGAPTSSFGCLLLGRALQGVGAAGVNMCVRTILADRVDLAEYSKNWTIFAIFSAVSFSTGPVVGGYLTKANWRWCFAINLPVAAVAVVLVVWLLRQELLGPQPLPELEERDDGVRRTRDKSTKRGRFLLRLATIDYGGQLLFLWGLGLLVLAFTWGGGEYPWESAAVLAPLVIGAVLTAAWLVYEYSMAPGRYMARVFPIQRAMMPWRLLAQRDIALLFVVNFTVGAAMFAVIYFMDIYFAVVRGNDASTAGLVLLYFLPGLGAGAFMSTYFTNVWPGQTMPTLLFGGVTSAVGITVLAWATHAENINLIYGMMALTGHGVGMRFNPGQLHGLAYFPTMTAQVTCLVIFAQPFGGTLGLTIMSTVLNNRNGPDHKDAKTGIMWAFISMIPIMWFGVFVTTFMGNVWILKDEKGNPKGHEVVHGVYLWNALVGRKLPREKMVREDVVNENGNFWSFGLYSMFARKSEHQESESNSDLRFHAVLVSPSCSGTY
ncbi:major facilitator superfamily domain-containing protein [Apodospora peruviana]|uniref:Major facilitator superfamily domain-containing protein n=1 Tax=Apodospora peruviana TaxID=516989 RepID=A0AAE0HV85_9PEZI|nr:major facilitator superfamily domain-containing protein [Apodospora peruviana]